MAQQRLNTDQRAIEGAPRVALKDSQIVRGIFAFMMSLTSGWTDAHTIKYFSSFGGMQTGNCLYFSISMAKYAKEGSGLTYGIINVFCIVCNVLGVAFFELVRRRWMKKGSLLFCAPIVLVFFMGADAIGHYFRWEWETTEAKWAVGLIAFSMGIQNCGCAPGLGTSLRIHTVFVTGNLHRFTQNTVQRKLLGMQDPKAKIEAFISIGTVIAMLLGAFIGASWEMHDGERWLFTPIGIIIATTCVIHDMIYHNLSPCDLIVPKRSNKSQRVSAAHGELVEHLITDPTGGTKTNQILLLF